MVRTKLKMNSDLKEAFAQIKPVCDVLMVCPSLESLSAYSAKVAELKKEIVQELQQYLLYPLITRIKCNEVRKRVEMHLKILEAVRTVLEKITVNSFEMYMKLETGLLSIIFDSNKPGMISDACEEVKYSTVRCLTVLMLNIPHEFRVKLLKNQVPMIAQAVFVSVHIAKLEKLRVLRLAAIHCITAHTMTHPQLTVEYRMANPDLELMAIDNLLSSILPGVLAALQDVCVCTDNPTHVIIVAAIEATHRILCIPMHNKYLMKRDVTTQDFVKMITERKTQVHTEVSNQAQKNPKDMAKRSEEWFLMAGEKLTLITKSLISLKTHEHFKVRKELAIFSYRILAECSRTMPASIPYCLDILISLSKDEYPEVAQYCAAALRAHFADTGDETPLRTLDSLCDNFLALLTSLPRVLNNIDSSRKLSALNLLHGYIEVVCDAARPQRLTAALSVAAQMQQLCSALAHAATHNTRLARHARHATRDVSAPPPSASPWSSLEYLDSPECCRRLQEICQLLGETECAELILDSLMEAFQQERSCEPVYVMNWMGSAPKATTSIARRIINTYIEESIWYLPLEVSSGQTAVTAEETLDVTVYNPRAWDKETVPDLYEGTVETRYTDISYRAPRAAPRDPGACTTLAQAQKNLALSCLLTEGLGMMAKRLQEGYQPYLLKTLCLILERVGSPYELLHQAGLKAINEIARACGHQSVGELIGWNADYFTNEITVRLKKAWNCQSALQILSVVMEYSDASILDCLYGIVEDVLVQSCDKYYELDLHSYLQVFLTFVQCIRKWYPVHTPSQPAHAELEIDLLKDVTEYIKHTQEAERLLSDSDFERDTGKSAEEMYKEDLKKKDEDPLDYDDTVSPENQPLPQHIKVTITILKRCLNFITSPQRDNALLSLQILNQGLPILAKHEDELLPLVHLTWSPLVARFRAKEPVVLRRAFDLLVTLAALSKDFIRSRTVKEVLPEMYKYLHKSAKDSYLKDAGSAYRSSQAYRLQLAALEALPSLAADLGLEDEALEEAMACVDAYLSNKQPKPLQALAVKFFKRILDYEYGGAWLHLRRLCGNSAVLEPPAGAARAGLPLAPVVGTPLQPQDKDYDTNVKLIFDFMVS